MATLQKRAIYVLSVGIILAIALVILFFIKGGVYGLENSSSSRIIIDILFIGVLALNLVITPLILKRFSSKKNVVLDERDISVIIRAPIIQLWAVIVSLLAWVITLTEIYWDNGQVPVSYLNIIFLSTLIISSISYSAGILIGYWRINHNV
jgi:hypothetical protein